MALSLALPTFQPISPVRVVRASVVKPIGEASPANCRPVPHPATAVALDGAGSLGRLIALHPFSRYLWVISRYLSMNLDENRPNDKILLRRTLGRGPPLSEAP